MEDLNTVVIAPLFSMWSLDSSKKAQSTDNQISTAVKKFAERYSTYPADILLGPIRAEVVNSDGTTKSLVIVPENTVLLQFPKKGTKIGLDEYKIAFGASDSGKPKNNI